MICTNSILQTCAAAAIALTAALARAEDSAQRGDQSASRPAVMIAGFVTAAGADERDRWTATAVEEGLALRLRDIRALSIVPTGRAFQARAELDESDEAAPAPLVGPAPPDWLRIAQLVGADWLITGECSGSGAELGLKIRLFQIDGDNRSSAAPLALAIEPGRVLDVIDSAARAVAEKLAPAVTKPAIITAGRDAL